MKPSISTGATQRALAVAPLAPPRLATPPPRFRFGLTAGKIAFALVCVAGLANAATAAGSDPATPPANATDAVPGATAAGAADAAADNDTAAASAADTAPAAEGPAGSFFAATTVTATGQERDAFEVATPVTVIGERELERRQVDNASDLLREQPGVDVNGVGPNQARPIIRGQRGLRVLFLENGLRMNNPRRQTDFGEISGLVDLDAVGQVEVVRGPASVLYGSDAIGGVLNLVTRRPPSSMGSSLGAQLDLRYGSAGDQQRGHAGVIGRQGRFAFRLGATHRSVDDYEAPAGRFGAIRLPRDTEVEDTGVDDDSVFGHLSYDFTDSRTLGLRFNRYRAEQTGFGYIPGAAYGVEEEAVVRILYPFQDFDRLSLVWNDANLGLAVADTVDVQAYAQSNERQLANDIVINIGPIFPGAPDSEVAALTDNRTDLDTLGLRAEAIKLAGGRHLLTYGAEGTRDESFNTDFSTTTTTIRFPFPPFERVRVTTDAVANTPNAEQTSWGVFVQDEITLHEKVRVTIGTRYQKVETAAEPTPGWDIAGLDFNDDQLVGAVTATYQINDAFNLLANWGTAFRSPNIVERLFNGTTPEGSGFQILNTGLESERSKNFDLGIKYRRANAFLEVVGFRTDISDGIVQYYLSPAEIAALPADLRAQIEQLRPQFVVQQRNVDRLRYEGVEMALGYRSRVGLVVGGSYTWLDAERIDSDNPPTGDTVGDKATGYLRYEPDHGRFWVEYRLRRNGSERANLDIGAPVPPVGEELPSFTLHALSGAVSFPTGPLTHTVLLTVDNLTDELYAEFSNATFFRPERGRNYVASYRLKF
jgi:TonB-dependent heme/hemoglobin receptor